MKWAVWAKFITSPGEIIIEDDELEEDIEWQVKWIILQRKNKNMQSDLK